MQGPLPELLHEWHDFYLLAGTASATLVGLMFVAVSIGAQLFNQKHSEALRAFISPTVVHFSAALFICILVTVPSHTYATLAALLAIGGVIGCLYSGRVWMQLFIRHRFHVDLMDRMFYALIPIAGYLLVVVAAGLLVERSQFALPLLAAALLVLLLAGIRNAWDMMIWIVINSPTIERPGEQGGGGGSGS